MRCDQSFSLKLKQLLFTNFKPLNDFFDGHYLSEVVNNLIENFSQVVCLKNKKQTFKTVRNK